MKLGRALALAMAAACAPPLPAQPTFARAEGGLDAAGNACTAHGEGRSHTGVGPGAGSLLQALCVR